MKNKFYLLLILNLFINEIHAKPADIQEINNKYIIELCKKYKQKKFLNYFFNYLKPLFRSSYNQDNPYNKTAANVRFSNDICDEEKNVISNRLKIIKTNTENFLGTKLSDNQVPRIAFCASGGGYRAMIATLGFLIGAQEINLMDSVLYSSSLSGSTWTFNAMATLGTDLYKLKENLSNNLSGNIDLGNVGLISIKDSKQVKKVITNLTKKYLFNQPICLTDIWGALLVGNIFAPLEGRQNLKISDQREKIKNGEQIFPIYTAIEPHEQDYNYNWYEFTPYEVGSHQLNSFIPIWALGRQFKNGTSIPLPTATSSEFPSEQTLANFIGIFGSAFEVNLREIIKILTESKDLNYIEKKAIDLLFAITPDSAEISRIMPAQISNFNFGIENSKNKNLEFTTFVDAGIDFNLPFPPLLRPERKIDVIIVLDSSSDLTNAPELAKAQKYAQKNNIKFPPIDFTNIEKKSLSIFMDKNDSQVPVIFYMPMIRDNSLPINNNPLLKDFDPAKCISNGFCGTFNLCYQKNETEQLCQLTRFNMVQNKENIKQLLNAVITKKKQK